MKKIQIREDVYALLFFIFLLLILILVHAAGSDSTAPTYSNKQVNSTLAGQPALFSLLVDDDTALDPNGQYVFSTNNSGTWENDTAVNFTATPSWANVTKTLNSTSGTSVWYKWYITDNASNMAVAGETSSLGTEGTYAGSYFSTSGSGDNWPLGLTHNDTFFWTADAGTGFVYQYWRNGTYTGFSFNASPASSITGITNNGTFFWITDSVKNNVSQYWMNGTYIGGFRTYWANPQGITTNNSFIWVLEGNPGDVVSKFFMNGTNINSFSVGNLQYDYISGITQDGTYFWISDRDNSTIYKYLMNGTYTGQTFTTDYGLMPQDIDTNGTYIWVSNYSYVYTYYGSGSPAFYLTTSGSTSGDSTAPSVSLNNPADSYSTTSNTIEFNATASDDVNLTNVSLYGNWSGSWAVNSTNSSPINDTLVNFTVAGLSVGTYRWNVLACDNSSNCAFNASNRTLTISSSGTTSPPSGGGGGGGGGGSTSTSTSSNGTNTTETFASNTTSGQQINNPQVPIKMSNNSFIITIVVIAILIIVVLSVLLIRARKKSVSTIQKYNNS